ncbi:hypothetical protein G3O08_19605 [Cryomorpha ignava]|uniref:Uncharacterized protein n=1 Tax=Cryomorpha ignava TaxID=101383 RepID=A0A7K3WVH3_9FLAO|nr:hypothetical protein [Cryomorpha ignava]NEN25699.1 hypothetical protein [Cryomorpha ignava]
MKQVDNLLSEIAEKPEKLTAPSDKKSTVTGAKGTIIYVDPNQLETVDGSPLGDDIQIELLEMTDNSSMLMNNTQTVSNGQILVTGGAYYLNMTSDGNQLRMKQGKGLEVEFPKLTEDEMGLFLGERDSLGQINWIQAEQNFNSKDLEVPEEPKPKKTTKKETYSEIDLILGYIENKEVEPLTKEEIEEYERQKREYETASKTYESVELMNFGWINCDRFWNDPSPNTDIQLLVNNDSLSGARMYAVFSDINSVVTAYYWQGMQDTASFKNVPIGKDLTIIALSAKNETPFIFETTINTATDKQVQIEFMVTTQAEIKEKMKGMN